MEKVETGRKNEKIILAIVIVAIILVMERRNINFHFKIQR